MASPKPNHSSAASVDGRDRALSHVVAEIQAGLRHGHFAFNLTCDVVSHGRRRLVLHAGKQYQSLISHDDCTSTTSSMEASSIPDEDATHPGHREPATGPIRD